MDCPLCKVKLVMSEKSGVEIDYCPKCRGIWLDKGELQTIVERSKAASQQYQEQQENRHLSQSQLQVEQQNNSEQAEYKKRPNPFEDILGIFDFD